MQAGGAANLTYVPSTHSILVRRNISHGLPLCALHGNSDATAHTLGELDQAVLTWEVPRT